MRVHEGEVAPLMSQVLTREFFRHLFDSLPVRIAITTEIRAQYFGVQFSSRPLLLFSLFLVTSKLQKLRG